MPLFNAPGWLLKYKKKTSSLEDTGTSDESLDKTVTFVPYSVDKMQLDRTDSKLPLMFTSNGQSGGETIQDFSETMIWLLFNSDDSWTNYYDTGKRVNLITLNGWYTLEFKDYDNATKQKINNCQKLYVVLITKSKKYAASDNRTGDKDFKVSFNAENSHRP